MNELRDLQDQHEREKKVWSLSVSQLNEKIKVSGIGFPSQGSMLALVEKYMVTFILNLCGEDCRY